LTVRAQWMLGQNAFVGTAQKLWDNGFITSLTNIERGEYAYGIKVIIPEGFPSQLYPRWSVFVIKHQSPDGLPTVRIANSVIIPEDRIDFSNVANIDLLPAHLLLEWARSQAESTPVDVSSTISLRSPRHEL
jgi:hypothetical protein